MRIKTLTMAALAWAGLGLVAAQGKEIVILPEAAKPDVKEEKATAVPNDPAEPPLKVEVSYGNSDLDARMIREVRTGRVVRGGARAAADKTVAVASSARGTLLTLNTPGTWQGSAKLTFKDSAPPMRFKMKLARMPGYDLQALTLSSDSLSLAVGGVTSGGTTKYFDAKGKAQERAEGAAYVVQARRRANGEVEIDLRRGAGAKLGKSLSVNWTSDLNNGRFFGGRGGMIIKD
jgi:hypothetical protein